MKKQRLNTRYHVAAAAVVLIALLVAPLLSQPAQAATYNLRAGQYDKTMPDGITTVPMWGYALDSSFGALDGTFGAAGPVLRVPAGDTTLTIQLDNDLNVPTSLNVIGQYGTSLTVVRNPDGRIRSINHETAAGNVTAIAYTWTNLTPGTYLYQSGTHMNIQVQMGLYGVLIVEAVAGEAYPGVAYNNEAIFLISEIDPALHLAVAQGTYGAPGPGITISGTMDYRPTYFFINGEAYPNAAPILAHPAMVNEVVLLRFLNAGLITHSLTMIGGPDLQLIAEDGKLFNFPEQTYAINLLAGKTRDATLKSSTAASVKFFDRRLFLSNTSGIGGGIMTSITVNPIVKKKRQPRNLQSL